MEENKSNPSKQPSCTQAASDAIRLRSATLSDKPSLVEMHERLWDRSELSQRLGPRAIDAFYDVALSKKASMVLLAEANGETVGYVTLIWDYIAFDATMFQRHGAVLMGMAVCHVLKHPLSVPELLRAQKIERRKKKLSECIPAHLGAIAIDPFALIRHRVNGIGTLLVDEVHEKARAVGVRDVWASTKRENAAALRMLKHAGYAELRNEKADPVVILVKSLSH